MAVRYFYQCVCIYRCLQLKELTVRECYAVTDAGMSMVISQCSQLRVLDLVYLPSITGMCALCEDPELILCLSINFPMQDLIQISEVFDALIYH